MFKLLTLFALGAGLGPLVGRAQNTALSPNTKFFSVDKYYAYEPESEPALYRATGFYEPGNPNSKPRIFLLPQLTVDANQIKFFADGSPVSPTSASTRAAITSINVPVSYSGSLPTESQSLGIAIQTENLPQRRYYLPAMKGANGQPVITNGLNMPNPYVRPQAPPQLGSLIEFMRQAVLKDIASHDSLVRLQTANLERWRGYRTEVTAINELDLSLVIDDEVVGQRHFAGTVLSVSGKLPMLVVKNPTPATIQRIQDGNFEVLVSYRFRDAAVGSIDASFDVAEIINDYVRETQTAITKSSASGMQLFNIGSRRTKVKQSMDESLTRNASAERRAGTVIVMDDANEDQVRRFDEMFFPALAQQQVITAHLAAAEEARAAGKTNLAAAHQKYADALQGGVTMAEVDAVGAAAALAAGDYATFLAKGVRYADTKTNLQGSFIRVASERVSTESSRTWTEVSKRSVQRAITATLQPDGAIAYRAGLGLCGARFGGPQYPCLITCMTTNSPLLKAGVANGEIIAAIEGQPTATYQQLLDALDQHSPGDLVRVTFVDVYGARLDRQVTLIKGEPK